MKRIDNEGPASPRNLAGWWKTFGGDWFKVEPTPSGDSIMVTWDDGSPAPVALLFKASGPRASKD